MRSVGDCRSTQWTKMCPREWRHSGCGDLARSTVHYQTGRSFDQTADWGAVLNKALIYRFVRHRAQLPAEALFKTAWEPRTDAPRPPHLRIVGCLLTAKGRR